MKHRIFISFLIVAVFNYISGCAITKTARINPENLILDQEIIKEIILVNLDVIEFDSNGARYAEPSDYVVGVLKDGKKFKLPVTKIKEFRTSNISPVKVEQLKNQKIKEMLLKNNILVTFDKNGGLYNEKDKKIVGKTAEQQVINLDINRVSEFYLETPTTISESDLAIQNDLKLTHIVTKGNYLLYTFNQDGGKLLKEGRKITGLTPQKEVVIIDPDSVLYLNVQRSDVEGTILANIGVLVLIIGVAALIVAATKQSCPFIYSFDGEKFVFDAEPLGGATTKGLERTEYSKMDYLKNIEDNFKILVRNEVEETQYIDELSLLAIGHDEDKQVIPDLNGNFFQIKDPQTPARAKDEKGMDLTGAVNADDNLYWQTKLPIDSNLISKSQRHELTFTFSRPANKTKAKLIANIGTSLWGSRMIREMLQLYGSSVDEYYKKIDEQESDYNQMMKFIETEELYKLKYYTKNGDDWVLQGFINGGGPLVSETRVYDLDLSNIKGDSVTIKINPPYGFWTVDYLAIQYDEYSSPNIETMVLETAINQDGINLKESIRTKDNNYFIMPAVGDYFEATYKAIENNSDRNATYYLKSSGYYEIHLNKSLPIQFMTLSKFITDPGFIIKYSNDRYSEWE
ncbi:MAG TPA: hypothetical protein VK870_06880, partial [Ignavibacteriaceae bacterium]|nr:hypothetical protein [Ignavibacteriaceae bacterium]